MHASASNDKSGNSKALDAVQAARQASMATLAQASGEELKAFWQNWSDKPDFEILRGPETGLVMLRGRIGGGGAPFNVGEATVTRATVRLTDGSVGHSYALGRDQEKARLAALFDALWTDEARREAVERQVLDVLRNRLEQADTKLRSEAAATKVDFFTMVRGDN
ncbi:MULTISPECIES: phosphonate C-P lyase system protein PhnG [Brucella/Ochrobactrum group]|nr:MULTISPECIES: phosphonate C-P lyase system protein PhnG [Brucella]MCI1002410.1 phosphonate C-P lyase system protein PhnG [Ochrobactrum sp. C6C9]RRD23588.1 phosphonate C-P lyase system protein PhnG [Brucellaceae bacterium VT-16-1752]WHT42999.1 phosphonate C-P lyase system protein PhnG [Ochrobactrum sp. SSR]MDX4073224.1 phosphonate C-P lyase system protein PhnG [Brucella sp. NBRC 113783]RLL76881.1 phosphonate C-P lyase system protein PhnG [[Ochrobactrum] soli]